VVLLEVEAVLHVAEHLVVDLTPVAHPDDGVVAVVDDGQVQVGARMPDTSAVSASR
jgi:hypothetical protein